MPRTVATGSGGGSRSCKTDSSGSVRSYETAAVTGFLDACGLLPTGFALGRFSAGQTHVGVSTILIALTAGVAGNWLSRPARALPSGWRSRSRHSGRRTPWLFGRRDPRAAVLGLVMPFSRSSLPNVAHVDPPRDPHIVRTSNLATKKAPERGLCLTAGPGLEPGLPDPESGVLPLDDPAPVRHSSASRGLRLEPVDRDEAFLGLGVDAGDDLDILFEAGAAKLRFQELVDLVEAR